MIIDGKELARKTREKLKIECDNLKKEGILSKLAVIMVGDDKASQIYVKNKSKACQEIGIKFEEYFLGNDIKQEELIELIQKLNLDKSINGILLQSPIPKSLDINEAFRTILPEKDVDGFNPINVGKLCLNQETFVSCTPYGINSHRLLVRGTRVPYVETEKEQQVSRQEESTWNQEYLHAIIVGVEWTAVGIGAVLVLTGLYRLLFKSKKGGGKA